MIGVDAAKTALYDRLKIQEPGPGYCHFPVGRDLEYFEQLTAEKKFTRYHNGFPKQEWKKPPNARNESLDARNYAYAGLHALYASGLKLAVYCARFVQMLRSRPPQQQNPAPATAAPATPSTPAPAAAPAPERTTQQQAPQPARPRRENPFTGRERGFMPERRNWFGRN
jgi:phage terminase large subunit GpA-like protein